MLMICGIPNGTGSTIDIQYNANELPSNMDQLSKKGVIIMGCPGSGKTLLARTMANAQGLHHVPLDPIISGARAISQDFSEKTSRSGNLLEWKDTCRIASPLIRGLISTYLERGNFWKLIVEWFRIDPEEFFQDQSENFRFVSLGYAEADPEKKFRNFRNFDQKNWTTKRSDEELLSDISFFIELSKHLREISARLGIPYVETSRNFEKSIFVAAKETIKNL